MTMTLASVVLGELLLVALALGVYALVSTKRRRTARLAALGQILDEAETHDARRVQQYRDFMESRLSMGMDEARSTGENWTKAEKSFIQNLLKVLATDDIQSLSSLNAELRQLLDQRGLEIAEALSSPAQTANHAAPNEALDPGPEDPPEAPFDVGDSGQEESFGSTRQTLPEADLANLAEGDDGFDDLIPALPPEPEPLELAGTDAEPLPGEPELEDLADEDPFAAGYWEEEPDEPGSLEPGAGEPPAPVISEAGLETAPAAADQALDAEDLWTASDEGDHREAAMEELSPTEAEQADTAPASAIKSSSLSFDAASPVEPSGDLEAIETDGLGDTDRHVEDSSSSEENSTGSAGRQAPEAGAPVLDEDDSEDYWLMGNSSKARGDAFGALVDEDHASPEPAAFPMAPPTVADDGEPEKPSEVEAAGPEDSCGLGGPVHDEASATDNFAGRCEPLEAICKPTEEGSMDANGMESPEIGAPTEIHAESENWPIPDAAPAPLPEPPSEAGDGQTRDPEPSVVENPVEPFEVPEIPLSPRKRSAPRAKKKHKSSAGDQAGDEA
jgi:hypothetical protein